MIAMEINRGKAIGQVVLQSNPEAGLTHDQLRELGPSRGQGSVTISFALLAFTKTYSVAFAAILSITLIVAINVNAVRNYQATIAHLSGCNWSLSEMEIP
jgi:hypothetical protein